MIDHSTADAGLAGAMADLTSVLDAENEALAKSDFGASGRLAESKREAITRLDGLAAAIVPGTRHNAADRAQRHRLEAAVSRNRFLLQQAIDTQQRVIATIVRALDPDEVLMSYPAMEALHRPALPVALTLNA